MKRPLPLFVLIALLPVGLIGFRLWQQELSLTGPSGGSGVVEGTEVAVSARIAARVVELPVKEGDAVRKGDKLVVLDCADPEAVLAEAEARLAAARAQSEAASAQASAASQSVQAAKAQASAASAQAKAVATQRDLADRQAGRLDAQKQDLPASSVDTSRSSADALTFQAEAAQASAKASSQAASASGEQASAAKQAADAAAAQVAAAEAAVRRAKLMTEECVVLAPRDGIVDALPYDAGELAPLGAVLARVVDLREVRATFYLPNAELAAAKPGGGAKIAADAWPDREFAGVVARVGATAAFTPRNVQTRTDRDRLVYPVEIVLPNPDGALRPGMPVQITLMAGGS